MATTAPTTTPTTTTAPSGIAAFPRGTTQITQANLVTQPIRPPDLVQRLTFSSETVKRLTADDFDLSSNEKITLKYDDGILVLFHVENTESYQLADIWSVAAQQVAGPVFGAINMLSERKVAEAFTRLKSDGSHPLHWASLRQYPFIMVYRKRWPVAVYNGPREVQALIDYALTLACEAGYYEILQTGGSMQSEARLEMGPYDVYTNIPGQPPRVRRESLQYTAEEPIRGFNPNIPLVATGSPAAQRAAGQVRTEEIREQREASEGLTPSLTEEEEATPTLEGIGEPPVTAPAVPIPGTVPVPGTVAPAPVAPAPVAPAPVVTTPEIAVPAAPGTPTE
jgi:hypothetical protein